MKVAGIDPGRKGCLVVVDTATTKGHAYKLAYDKAGHLDCVGLVEFLTLAKPGALIIEKVSGFRGSGATQTFSFGFACGELNAVVTSWASHYHASLVYVLPQSWQKVVHVGTPQKETAKDKSLLAYKRLFPHQPFARGAKGGKVDDNLVDALLIATYGVLKIANSTIRLWDIDLHKGASI
jgi:hypothetical protein